MPTFKPFLNNPDGWIKTTVDDRHYAVGIMDDYGGWTVSIYEITEVESAIRGLFWAEELSEIEARTLVVDIKQNFLSYLVATAL